MNKKYNEDIKLIKKYLVDDANLKDMKHNLLIKKINLMSKYYLILGIIAFILWIVMFFMNSPLENRMFVYILTFACITSYGQFLFLKRNIHLI